MAKQATFPAGSAAFRELHFRFLPSTGRTLGARCAGSLNPSYFCAPATEELTTKTVLVLLVRRSVGCLNTNTGLWETRSKSARGRCPHLRLDPRLRKP